MGAQNRLRPRGAPEGYDPNAQNPFTPGSQDWNQFQSQQAQYAQDYDDRRYWDETAAQYDATRAQYEQMLSGLGRPENLQAIQSRYGQVIGEAGDPNRYAERTQEMIDRSNVAQTNRAAQMGMAGSSAAFGSAAEAQRGIEMSMRDRRMSEALQGAQFETGIDQALYQRRLAEMAAQGGLMELDAGEIRQLQAMLAGQDAANAQAQAGILSGLGSIAGGVAGTFIGGPGIGTMAGAAAGGSLLSAPTGYSSPAFGSIGQAPNVGFAGMGGFASPGSQYSYNPYDFMGGGR